jgi:transposase-like protein
MPRIHYKEEQIIAKLRKADLLFVEGKTKGQVCKALEITPVTFARWQKKYGAMTMSEAKRLKELERENARLKRIVADQAIDLCVLKDFAKGNL